MQNANVLSIHEHALKLCWLTIVHCMGQYILVFSEIHAQIMTVSQNSWCYELLSWYNMIIQYIVKCYSDEFCLQAWDEWSLAVCMLNIYIYCVSWKLGGWVGGGGGGGVVVVVGWWWGGNPGEIIKFPCWYPCRNNQISMLISMSIKIKNQIWLLIDWLYSFQSIKCHGRKLVINMDLTLTELRNSDRFWRGLLSQCTRARAKQEVKSRGR